jgi:hypothetical protein
MQSNPRWSIKRPAFQPNPNDWYRNRGANSRKRRKEITQKRITGTIEERKDADIKAQ